MLPAAQFLSETSGITNTMPRRAYFVFHQRGDCINAFSRILFQCPEGLILYFTL